MTPKRYLAFGCITLLIQGGLIAAQDMIPVNVEKFQMNSGSAMGQAQAINLSIAMRSSVEAKKTPQKELEPKQEIVKVQKPAPIAEPIETPTAVAKAVAKPIIKPSTQAKPTKLAKTEPKQQVEELIQQPIKDADKEPMLTASADVLVQSQNQAEVTAKQGVSQEAITLSRPTFSSPPAQPRYPKLARKRGFEGTAMIEVMFNHIGEQLSLTLINSSGFSLLDRAAITAVEQWQFSPPSPQTAFAYTVKVPVKFALN
ncbi:energy transducer TonB [Shewanella psychropiezotolerans]|uniref:Energy transducer TonB n=1 Tax=Shewanella psychropiezotolerans TaxID=2593655 RepID=A0ABX5X8S4_9GAMM|nr:MULTISPECIES: energy transducer TonB [Shewanella]MPY23599.1 energy transducer TonB [Shewanella sp. YLB-07]QDO85656.1 energy transducer TonB [Shewanella psychropiezotolerans]